MTEDARATISFDVHNDLLGREHVAELDLTLTTTVNDVLFIQKNQGRIGSSEALVILVLALPVVVGRENQVALRNRSHGSRNGRHQTLVNLEPAPVVQQESSI